MGNATATLPPRTGVHQLVHPWRSIVRCGHTSVQHRGHTSVARAGEKRERRGREEGEKRERRGRTGPTFESLAVVGVRNSSRSGAAEEGECIGPVSYTHLTLPTICSV
eukprot:2727057-Prymnesium_polylepis.1